MGHEVESDDWAAEYARFRRELRHVVARREFEEDVLRAVKSASLQREARGAR